MKKPNKENPLITFRKANDARQAVVKKSMKKFQPGGEKTPFQSYMTTKGATAADTSATMMGAANKITENKPLLKKAYELTYGQDFGDSGTANPYRKDAMTSRRGDHSGYRDMSNPARKSYEAEVVKNKKNKKGGAIKTKNK
jgi:hypothetical protein